MAGQNKERNYAMNKILIIDDDRELCALIKRSVQAENIEADFCNTGKEGLQKLKEQEYQLVVLDVMMPGMDGFETLEEIRKENSLPILMFTSKNDSISKVRGLRAGADDYLTKPFDMDELIARIASLIRRYKDKKLFSQYSLGMKQRLAIALAVMHDPELLILDEPINGLDPIGIAEVRSFIRELCDARGKTILISSHILSEISLLADDIGIIDHGALLEEESLAELEQKSSKHIRFTLSDTAQAARILERNFHENHFSIQDDHNLRLHNLDLPVGKIVTAFVENGLEVSESCKQKSIEKTKKVPQSLRDRKWA